MGIRVPKRIKAYRTECKTCRPEEKKIWKKESVNVPKKVKKNIKVKCTKRIMVPKTVTSYKYKTQCRKVPVGSCEFEPSCEMIQECESKQENACDEKKKGFWARLFS